MLYLTSVDDDGTVFLLMNSHSLVLYHFKKESSQLVIYKQMRVEGLINNSVLAINCLQASMS